MTIFYRLDRQPSEDVGEGEDWSEWFTSLAAAKRRRAELIAEDPALQRHPTGEDFGIYRVRFAELPPKALLLRVLNRAGYATSEEPVVAPYRPTKVARAEAEAAHCPARDDLGPHEYDYDDTERRRLCLACGAWEPKALRRKRTEPKRVNSADGAAP